MNPVAQRSVAPIPVARPYMGREEEELVVEVLRSGWLSQGPRLAEFEERFAEYVGAKHAVAVSSCTTALHLALQILGIKPGDKVLCPSFSFIASANAIVHCGAIPVFVDIDRETYNIDPARIEEAITPGTRAILVVHQVGLPAALGEILAIARQHNLPVLEDAACAVGSEYDGRRVGAPHGSMACFSFHPRKILTTGEGGMITTNDPDHAIRLRRLRQHAMTLSDLARHQTKHVVFESYAEVGFNYRMTDLQAAVGLIQLQRMDNFLSRRRFLANRYSERLRCLPWLIPPKVPQGCRHNFQSYMARLTLDAPVSRNELMQALMDKGISTRRGIMAIHREAPYCQPSWENKLPETNSATDETIILPLFHQMSEEDQDRIIESIRETALEAAR